MDRKNMTGWGANVRSMDARNTPATAERVPFSEADFLKWLGEERTPALISTNHERYYAFCVEFGIAGSGATEDEAVRDATDLLMKYLLVSFAEGRPYRESKKSPPTQIRVRSWYLVVRKRFLGRLKPSLSRLGGLISVPTTDRNWHGLAQ